MGASEYELYLNFSLRWHPERVCLQRIRWRNAPSTAVDPQADARRGHVFVAYHTQYDDLGRRRTDAQGTPDEEYAPRFACLHLARHGCRCVVFLQRARVCVPWRREVREGWMAFPPGYMCKAPSTTLGCRLRC
jgi:hypothetical protein